MVRLAELYEAEEAILIGIHSGAFCAFGFATSDEAPETARKLDGKRIVATRDGVEIENKKINLKAKRTMCLSLNTFATEMTGKIDSEFGNEATVRRWA